MEAKIRDLQRNLKQGESHSHSHSTARHDTEKDVYKQSYEYDLFNEAQERSSRGRNVMIFNVPQKHFFR